MLPPMTVHTIMLPDRMRGREPRSVIWDDDAGTVEGDHYWVPWMQQTLASAPPVVHEHWAGTLTLRDPAHDPADFLCLLAEAYWPILDPDRDLHRLPPALHGVTPTQMVPHPPPTETLPDGTVVELVPGRDYVE